MDPDQLKKLLKRIAITGSFFLLAILLYLLGGSHFALARRLLIAYVLIVTAVMVLAILLQSGRGGGLASLGGLSGDSLLGARSATPIAKATYVMGALFLLICMLIARLSAQSPAAVGSPGLPEVPPIEAPASTSEPGAADEAGGQPDVPPGPPAGGAEE